MTASYIPIGLPGNLKNRTGHRDAECVEGEEEWEDVFPSTAAQEVWGSVVGLLLQQGPRQSPDRKRKRFLYTFYPKKTPLINFIKCC